MTLTRRQVVELLDRHDIVPSRARGQNFVVDPNTVRRIVRLAGVSAGDRVVEIGPGLGSLTLALHEAGAEVTAVEVDRRLVAALADVVAGTGVRVVEADAFTVDWDALLGAGGSRSGPWSMVANLPYNMGTPLVLQLLDGVPAIERMLVMIQREVGERLAAPPGDPAYGIPSVRVAYWATADVVGRVSPEVFLPRPRVDSALVRIVRRPQPAVSIAPDRLFPLVRAGFGQRRKMLRRSLAGMVSDAAFAAAGIAPDRRPEQLSIEEWGRLAEAAS